MWDLATSLISQTNGEVEMISQKKWPKEQLKIQRAIGGPRVIWETIAYGRRAHMNKEQIKRYINYTKE